MAQRTGASTKELDLYAVDALLSVEERMIRDTVWDFARESVLPHIVAHYRAGTFPKELFPVMGELGILGANLDGYGCAGLGDVAYGLTLQSLERADSGLRSAASVQGALVMFPIHAYGSKEQKQHWLPRLAKGETIGCFGLTEPNHGSDPGSMQTHAERSGSGYVLNGTKQWITNGSLADLSLVWARADGTVRGFLVERGTAGFSAQEEASKLSLRASDTSTLFLEDVEVPEDSVLPGVEGMKGPLSCLSQARYGIAWGAIGAAQACFLKALEYAKERHQFGRPIASFQLVQAKGTGQSRRSANQHGQTQQRLLGARNRAHGARNPRRERHQRRERSHAACVQPGVREDVRGDARNSHADSRRGAHRHRRVSLAGCSVGSFHPHPWGGT
jgi:glutaryl-CoA dehydrogenase